MSFLDVLTGKKPLMRPTFAQRLRTVEQDFATLCSTTGVHDVRNPYPRDRSMPPVATGQGSFYSRDCGDPGLASIEPDEGSLSPAAISALMSDRNQNQGAKITYVTLTQPQVSNAQADYAVDLPFPCNVFWVSSSLHITNSIYLHFEPIGNIYNGAGIALGLTGKEKWFPMDANNISGPPYFGFLKFGFKSRRIYFDFGRESGAATVSTIGCADSDDMMFSGGSYT